jgi:uncharacterized protein YyaL (SSP411 family)
VRAALHAIGRYPEGHATLLQALDELLAPPAIVVVRAPDAELDAWRAALHGSDARATPDAAEAPDGARGTRGARYRPHELALLVPSDAQGLRGLLAERAPRAGGGVAYVCEGMTCRAPIDTPSGLAAALAAAR